MAATHGGWSSKFSHDDVARAALHRIQDALSAHIDTSRYGSTLASFLGESRKGLRFRFADGTAVTLRT